MDPSFFHLDGEAVFEVLVAIVIASFFIERALAVVFGHRTFVQHLQGKGAKEIIALIVGIVVAWYWNFDAMSVLFPKEATTVPGIVFTGFIIAGGSKGAVKLFRDVMGFKTSAEMEYEESRRGKRKPKK